MRHKIIVLAATLFAIAIAVTIYSTSGRLWLKSSKVTVVVNGEPKNSISIYAGPAKQILVRLSEIQGEESDYIYNPDSREIGVLSSTSQFIYLPGIAICKDAIPGVILLSDRIKVETDKNVVIDANFVEFTSLDGLRTRINH
jgi:hypothetical protein